MSYSELKKIYFPLWDGQKPLVKKLKFLEF